MKNLNFSKVNIFLIFVCVLGGIMCGGSVGWGGDGTEGFNEDMKIKYPNGNMYEENSGAANTTTSSDNIPQWGPRTENNPLDWRSKYPLKNSDVDSSNSINDEFEKGVSSISSSTDQKDNNAAAAPEAAANLTNAPNGVTPKNWKAADEALTTIKKTYPLCMGGADASIKKLDVTIESCKSKSKFAAYACLGAFSPILQKAVAGIGGATALADTAMSFSKTCSKLKDALKIGDMALTAYNAACTAASLVAKSSCKKMIEAIGTSSTDLAQAELITSTTKPKTDPTYKQAMADCINAKNDVAKRLEPGTNLSKINDDYKWNMVAAGIGLVGIAKNMFLTKKCEEKTEDESSLNCAEGSTDPLCSYVTMDCTSKKDQNKVECICKNKPNAAGCSGSNITDLGNGGSNSLERTPINTNTIQTPSSTNLTSGFDGAKSLAGQNTGGGSTGGGLNGADTAKGFGGGNLKDKEAVKSKITATGASDLSGGGGGSSGSGGGYADAEYKAYVRGGAKNPHRDVAGFGSQVTGSGGKSNWEKVSDRYKINRTSLIDQ